MEEMLTLILEKGYLTNIVVAILIFVIGNIVAKRFTKFLISKLSKSDKVDETLEKFLSSVLYSLFIVVIVLAALRQLGVETTSFIAVLGAAGLAIALAFQSTLSNISAGVMIIIFRPFKIGDLVDAAGVMGIVEEINIFQTLFRTTDNKAIVVGNSSVISSNIINYSKKDTRRVDLVFGVSYSDDLKLVKETLKEVLQNDERILKEPEPFVAVSELADSSVNFITRSWVKTADYWPVYHDTLEKVKLTFDEKDITIPFPQMDIHQDK